MESTIVMSRSATSATRTRRHISPMAAIKGRNAGMEKICIFAIFFLVLATLMTSARTITRMMKAIKAEKAKERYPHLENTYVPSIACAV